MVWKRYGVPMRRWGSATERLRCRTQLLSGIASLRLGEDSTKVGGETDNETVCSAWVKGPEAPGTMFCWNTESHGSR